MLQYNINKNKVGVRYMHEKHRERLRKKFLADPSILERHELLELLLTFCIPRKNTNNIAHELIDNFGSLSEILNADEENLLEIKGIGKNTVLFLKLVKIIFDICHKEKDKANEKIRVTNLTLEDVKNIMMAKFMDVYEENVALVIFNKKRKIVFCDFIEKGSLRFVDVDFRKIIFLALKYNARYLIIAHNHPSKIALPSKEDIKITSQLELTLKTLDITLLDHLIFCGEEYASFRECKVIGKEGNQSKDHLKKVC